jgi:hypothetical protein
LTHETEAGLWLSQIIELSGETMHLHVVHAYAPHILFAAPDHLGLAFALDIGDDRRGNSGDAEHEESEQEENEQNGVAGLRGAAGAT